MNIGISTACFYPMYTEDAIKEIARLNFNEIEIFFNSESEFNIDYIKSLRELVNNYNIKVKSIHPFTSPIEGVMFFSDYKRRTQDSMDQYKRYFEAASILGANYFTFHGERNINVAGIPSASNIKHEVYHELCKAASNCGIVFTQENVAWCKSCDPAYLKNLYDNIPELMYTLDIKQAKRASTNLTDYLSIMSDRIRNVHINDYTDAQSCLLPGEGDMNYNCFFNKLSKLDYDTSVLIEIYSSNYQNINQITKSANFLRSIVD